MRREKKTRTVIKQIITKISVSSNSERPKYGVKDNFPRWPMSSADSRGERPRLCLSLSERTQATGLSSYFSDAIYDCHQFEVNGSVCLVYQVHFGLF